MRRRLLIAAASAVGAVGVLGQPALACNDCGASASSTTDGGSVAVGQIAVSAGAGRQPGPSAPPGDAPGPSAGAAPAGGNPIECVVYGASEAASGYGDESTPLDTSTIAPGTRVFQVCTDTAIGEYVSAGELDWPAAVAAAGAPAVPLVPPEVVARFAQARLVLPPPSVRSWPAHDSQVVRVPTWLRVDNFTSFSETASVGPVSATVTAAPVRTTWRMGDGGEVTCGDGGATYPGGGSPAPECSYTFRRSSAGQPGQAFAGSVSITWALSWTSNVGEAGDLGSVVMTTPVSWGVDQIQALITDGGGR